MPATRIGLLFVALLSVGLPAPLSLGQQLLPEAARLAVETRLKEVRQQILGHENQMYALAEEHDSLVTSRDRWYSEIDRVQTEARKAARDLIESQSKAKEMRKRAEALKASSKEQLESDEQLKTLLERLQVLKNRKAANSVSKTLKDSAKATLDVSLTGEILDAQIEIAQRRESLRLSYLGGQAADLDRRLLELESDMVVKADVKKVLDERLAELKTLSPFIKDYMQHARQVEELQILHRRLADLNAQQQVELLKAIGAAVPARVATLGTK